LKWKSAPLLRPGIPTISASTLYFHDQALHGSSNSSTFLAQLGTRCLGGVRCINGISESTSTSHPLVHARTTSHDNATMPRRRCHDRAPQRSYDNYSGYGDVQASSERGTPEKVDAGIHCSTIDDALERWSLRVWSLLTGEQQRRGHIITCEPV